MLGVAGESLKSLWSDCTEIILPKEGCALKSLCCLRVVYSLGKGFLTGMQVYTSLCRDRKSSSAAAEHSIYPCTLILHHLPQGTDVLLSSHLLIEGPNRHSMQRLQVCTAPAPNCYTPAVPVSSGLSKARLFLWPKLELWARSTAGARS